MFKLRSYQILFLCLLIYSCSSHKNDYDAVVTTINEIKSPFSSYEKDTIELIDYSYKLYGGILKGYKTQKEIVVNNKLKPSTNFYVWIDKKYAWILTDKEIDYMIKTLKNQKKEFWDINKFKNSKKNIQLVDNIKFDDQLTEDIERQKRIKSDKFVYFFSKPVFNKKKDIFIIQYEILLLPNTRMTLIYKKENGLWVQIGSLSPN